MHGLDRAGIVSAQRGPGGGYTLQVSPKETSAYGVITAVASLPRIESCPLGIEGHTQLCPLHKRLDDVAELVEQAFKQTSISVILPDQSSSRRSACRFPGKS